MHSYTFLISWIVASAIVSVDSRVNWNKLHSDHYDPYELFRRRSTSDFTEAQRKFQKQVLDAHNEYRARHCVSPLELDDELNLSAEKYAQYLADKHKFGHSGSNALGENLYKKMSTGNLQTLEGE